MGLQHRGLRPHRPPRRRDRDRDLRDRHGEPLVYFHGGGTFHGFEWARALASEFRVFCPYHPNFGESGDAPFDQMTDYVQHYEMLFPALGLDTFILAGASMGGHMAARYAAANPGDIDKLALVSAAASSPIARRSPISARSRRPTCRRCSSPTRPGSSLTGRPTRRPNGPRCARANPPRRSPRARTSPRPTARCATASRVRPADAAAVGRGRPHRPARLRAGLAGGAAARRAAVIPGGSHLLLDEFPAAVEALRKFLKA
jgi:pimeloyl-ACP methyl ester carboxylesterase